MREFELVIDEALTKGFSPERMTPFNSQFLYNALGFRCGRLGLEAAEVGENPLPDTVDVLYDWPFPQYITGERYNFLIVRDSVVNHEDVIYVISDDHSTVTHVFSIDELTFGQGSLVEVADFGEYAMLVNGVVMVYWNVLGAWNASVETAIIPLMRTMCNFKGQAVGGGVTSTWYDCDETFYIWSKIGSMDFTPDRDNEAGYRRDPFGGNVKHVRRLGDMVIGYSTKGVTAIAPVSEPATTFGFTELVDVGIINQGAMAGNLKRQIYVGTDLKIREITQQGVKELGYDYRMDDLDGEDIIVLYDRYNGDFYIGNSEKTYLLSPQGMTELQQHPSAVWRATYEDLYMLPDTLDDTQSLITSECFDFGYKGQKTIFSIETDAFLGENPMASADYAFDISTWGYGSFIPINNQGIASIISAGNFFMFNIKFDSYYEGSRIGYIKVRYKVTDLRGLRGVYAPSPRGQA